MVFDLLIRNLVINGFHLFYVKGDLLLRIKTQGDPSGPRFNQARLSVANLSNSFNYENEWVKADKMGMVRGMPNKK